MTKQRSKGVTIWAWFFMIGSAYSLFTSLKWFLFPMKSEIRETLQQFYKIPVEPFMKWSSVVACVTSILVFFIGLNLLKLNEKARKALFYYSAYTAITALGMGFIMTNFRLFIFSAVTTLILLAIQISYFTRPHVVKQFQNA